MSSTVYTPVASNGVSTTSAWRNRIHALSDGYRAVFISDGTNLILRVTQQGTAWSSAQPVLTGITAISNVIDTIFTNNVMWIFVASGTTVTAYSANYYNGGVFGTLSAGTVVSTQIGAIQSIRVVYDAVSTTNDSQHTGGTAGLVFLLSDHGSAWQIEALDINSTATGGIKSILKTNPIQLTGFSGPTYATNMILRATGKLYIVSPGNVGWAACEVLYNSIVTVNTANTQPSSFTSVAHGSWLYENYNTPQYWPRAGMNYEIKGSVAPNSGSPVLYTPILDSVRGAFWGSFMTPAFTKACQIPAGAWTATIPLTTKNVRGVLNGTCRVYQRNLFNGIPSLLGTLTATAIPLTSATSYSMVFTGTLPVQNIASGNVYYLEPDFNFASLRYNNDGTDTTHITITPGTTSLTTPSTILDSTTTTYSFTASALESIPTTTLPLCSAGAALCPSDTSSNPGVDLYVPSGNSFVSTTRGSTGGYSLKSTIVTLTSGTLSTTFSLAATMNPITGDKNLFALGYLNPNNGYWALARTNNLWGAAAFVSSGATSWHLAAGDVRSLGAIGASIVFGGSTAYYDPAAGLPGGVNTGPTSIGTANAPFTGTGVPPFPGSSFGIVAPFNDTMTQPWFSFIHNATPISNAMSAYRILVQHGAGVTDWDSNIVNIVDTGTSRPLPGSLFSVQYGAYGYAPVNANLSPNVLYTVTIYTYDQGSGSVQSASATFRIWTAPTVSVTAPNPIGSLQTTVTFTPTSAEGLSFTQYQVQLLDVTTSVVQWDSGLLPCSIASGTPFTSPTLDITPAAVPANLNANQANQLQPGAAGSSGQTAAGPSLAQSTPATWLKAGGGGFSTTYVPGGAAGGYTLASGAAGLSPTTPTSTPPGLPPGWSGGGELAPPVIPPGGSPVSGGLWNGGGTPGVYQNQNYVIKVIAYASPASGALIAGSGILSTQLQTAPSVQPHDLVAFAVQGSDPLHGGLYQLTWIQDAPSGGLLSAAFWNIYAKSATDVGFTLINTQPAKTGTAIFEIYSVGASVPYTFAVSSITAAGVESDKAVYTPTITLDFRLGLWFNDPDNPKSCVELGLFESGGTTSTYPLEYEHLEDKDVASLFNRGSPVLTVGSLNALHTSSNPTFALEIGYEKSCLQLLNRWRQYGTVIQIRDFWGNVFFGCILSLKEGAAGLSIYRTVTVELQQLDAGNYSGIVSPA